MSEILSSMVYCLLEALCMILLIHKIYADKPEHFMRNTIVFVLTLFISIFIININSKYISDFFNLFIVGACMILYLKITYKISYLRTLIVTSITMFVIIILEMCSGFLILIYQAQPWQNKYLDTINTLGFFVLTILMYMFLPIKKLYDFVLERKIVSLSVSIFLGLVAGYLLLTWRANRFVELETLIFLLLFMIVVLMITLEWRKSYADNLKKQKDIELFTMYSKTFESLIYEIRTRQHEYDNQICGIINSHAAIDNYEELVECQMQYIKELKNVEINEFLPLLKIKNKIMAGFLYSKVLKAVQMNLNVKIQIIDEETDTKAADSDLISVIGILLDNAIEACDEIHCNIIVSLDSVDGKMLFEIWNQHEPLLNTLMMKFFERGYSTKDDGGRRGIGLYHANQIVTSYDGQLQIENVILNNENYIRFSLIL